MTTLADMQKQAAQAEPQDDQAQAAPQAPAQPDRTVFHVEREKLGEGMGETVKPYRRFFGKPPKGLDLERVEVEWDSQDDQKGSDLWVVPAGCGDAPGGEGSSDRMKDGRIFTFTPERFGTDAERLAAGKKPLQRLRWEEHNYVAPDFDADPASAVTEPAPPEAAPEGGDPQ